MKFVLFFCIFDYLFIDARANLVMEYDDVNPITYKQYPAPDKHRCGVCPTYFQKICALDNITNATFIFDNHCVMDLYNCIEGSHFIPMKYQNCIFFGNFAYVHGFKYENMDYGEDHVIVQGSQKNPDFIRRFAGLTENIFDFSD